MASLSSAGASQDDESLCKRYKLEDQLSDIQFIDCSTPEHTSIGLNGAPQGGSTTSSTTVVNTIFTSAQVHKPPQQEDSSEDQHEDETLAVGLRNSYPGPQYAQFGKFNSSPVKETRFSYPGSGGKEKAARKEKASLQNAGSTSSVVEKVQSMSVDEQSQPQPATMDVVGLKKNESSLYER